MERWTDVPAASSLADSLSQLPESLASSDGTELSDINKDAERHLSKGKLIFKYIYILQTNEAVQWTC